ncbi:hypothetical protein ACJ72_03064 [Emergomyces africanus]|uniref:Uncharacterized protein n=1 Tax=Emergomyces africanus TaxID=1955775 RepID=A0A1B7P136_9EURO|nr:hypothetical protein ACJ72_03064 [Emergomyces africanus]
MEKVDTVDVSWLHHSQKDNLVRTKSAPSVGINGPEPISTAPPMLASSLPTENYETTNGASVTRQFTLPAMNQRQQPAKQQKGLSDAREINECTPPPAPTASPAYATVGKPLGARPPATGRRNSWISSLSQKFSSSGSTPPAQSNTKDTNAKQPAQTPRPELPNPFGASFSPKEKADKPDETTTPFDSRSPKSHPSFFQNAFRKLSSSSSVGGGLGKIATQGVVSERRVMNVDRHRDRCKITELNQAKLRRVAFCVDVEIAGMSRRSESEEEASQPQQPQPTQQAPQLAPPQVPAKKKSTMVDQIRGFKRQDTKAAEKAEDTTLKPSQAGTNEGQTEVTPIIYAGETKLSDPAKEKEKPAAAKEQTRKQVEKKGG